MSAAMQAAQLLLECLRTELNAGPNPPGIICLRSGGEVQPDIGTEVDECCTGLAWVRIAEINTVIGNSDDYGQTCIIRKRAHLQMGVVRCKAFGTVGQPLDCDGWTALALQMDADSDAMSAAACCLTDTIDTLFPPGTVRMAFGDYIAGGPDGNCMRGTMSVTLDIDCGTC